MIFIKLNDKNEVIQTHYRPSDLSDEVLEKGYLVDSIPDMPEGKQKRGKARRLKYYPDTKTFEVVEIDRPLRDGEKLDMLNERITKMEDNITKILSKIILLKDSSGTSE